MKRIDLILEYLGNWYTVCHDGTIIADRPRVNTFVLDELRIEAANIFLVDKKHELSRNEKEYWKAVRLTTGKK